MRLQQCCFFTTCVYMLVFTLHLDDSTEQRSSVPGEHLIVCKSTTSTAPIGFH